MDEFIFITAIDYTLVKKKYTETILSIKTLMYYPRVYVFLFSTYNFFFRYIRKWWRQLQRPGHHISKKSYKCERIHQSSYLFCDGFSFTTLCAVMIIFLLFFKNWVYYIGRIVVVYMNYAKIFGFLGKKHFLLWW